MSAKKDKKVRKETRKRVKEAVQKGELPLEMKNTEQRQRENANDAIIVPIGDLTNVDLGQVPFDPNYEAMTEDFIGTFNHGVTQGMPPQNALFAFGSAFAVVLGCAIRAGLPQGQVGKLLMMIGRNAAVSSKMVQVLQGQSVGQAVASVMKSGRKMQ
jgi:hypothetical protein